jgi:hypothetical protein
MSGIQYRRGLRPSTWISPELENLVYVAPGGKLSKPRRADKGATLLASDVDLVAANNSVRFATDHALKRIPPDPSRPPVPTIAEDNEAADHVDYGDFFTEMRRQDTAHTAARKRSLGWEVDENTNDTSSLRKMRRQLCAQAFQAYPAVREHFDRKAPTSQEYIPKVHQFVVAAAINWPSDYLLEALPGQIVGMVLWFVSIMYGSVHLAAWREHFPSDAERLLWHMSAGYIAASGFWWTVAHVLFYMWPWLDDWWGRFVRLRNHWLQYVVYGFLMICAGTFYILARAYLTLEGIVSLRSAPRSMYETVAWSRFIPISKRENREKSRSAQQ